MPVTLGQYPPGLPEGGRSSLTATEDNAAELKLILGGWRYPGLLVLLRSQQTVVTCGMYRPPVYKAWMPLSCRSSGVDVASTPYTLVRTVPE